MTRHITVPDYVCRSKVSGTWWPVSPYNWRHPLRYEYLWEDGVKYRKPTKLPAPEYVDALMNWAQNLLDDETAFPNKIGSSAPSSSLFLSIMPSLGVPFPKNFRETVRTIIRRLFRVYAHIYSNHFDHICALGIEGASRWWTNLKIIPSLLRPAHLNTSYKHFFLFINEVCTCLASSTFDWLSHL